MANRRFTQFFSTLHNKPVLLDCNFVVDSANANGLGISALKGPGISQVFMHTSQTPGSGNPNPANGYALVKLSDNYSGFYACYSSVISPVSGASLLVASAGLTVGQPYVITILGTTTTAQWQGLGVPIGTTPAVGVSFIAAATSALGTGAVQLPRVAASNIVTTEVIGTPNLQIKSSAAIVQGTGSGSYLIIRFLGAAFAGSALGTHTHDFTVIGGQAASTTNNIANYAGPILGKEQATNATYVGANSATNGGVVAVSAGTPAGSVSLVTAAPADGSVVSLGIYLSNSSIIVQGE